MYAALRLELPAAVGPDQRDRNDLLIVSDMFQVRERRVELGHIEVGVIADFAKPVVPDFLRLADDVVFIVLAEQAVGLRMLLRIIYIALDQNSHFSHFKLFQLVSRRGFVRGLGGSRLCVLYLDFSFTVVQNPLAILVADQKLQRCLARIVELMRLRFFVVVLCDIRRGLDGHVVFLRLIQSRRFCPVERLALRVGDQVVVFRPAAGGADVRYLNLPDSGFQIVIGGGNGFVRRGRVALLPDGVDGLGAVCMLNVNRVARPILRIGRSRIVSPTSEGVAVTSRLAIVDVELVAFRRCGCRNIPARTTSVVKLVNQMVGVHGGGRVGFLRYEINRSALVAGGRTAHVKRPGFGICIGFFRPTDDLVTAVDTCTTSCCLDVTDGDCVIVICRVAMIRRVLANKLRIFRSTIIVANIEFVTHIQDSESNIDLVSCIQSRQCVERQQGQCHHKHQNPSQQPLSCFLSSHKKIPPSFGRNTAHRRGSMNASATGCHAVRGHRLGSWLCDTGFRRLCLLSAHLLVSVSRTAYD